MLDIYDSAYKQSAQNSISFWDFVIISFLDVIVLFFYVIFVLLLFQNVCSLSVGSRKIYLVDVEMSV